MKKTSKGARLIKTKKAHGPLAQEKGTFMQGKGMVNGWMAKLSPGQNKLLLLLTIIIGAGAFLFAATSTLTNWFKAPLLLATLYASGSLIAKFGKLESYHGIIILRGEKGFAAMRYFAKHPRLMRALADFGLSLGFGMIYSVLIYRRNFTKIFAHFVLVASIFWILLAGSNITIFGNDLKEFVLPAIGVLGGLLAFGIASLIIQAMNILTVPDTAAGATLVVPGVTIPFWEGLIAIVIAATIHEIAHGVLAMVEKLEVKNSGAILFGVLPIGAFVEPNEKKLAQLEIQKKRRILIAGTTSNFLLFLLVAPIANFLWAPYVLGQADGIAITGLTTDSASIGILKSGEIIRGVDGKIMKVLPEFQAYMKGKKEGDVVRLSTSAGERQVALGKDGKIGITLETHFLGNPAWVAFMLFVSGTLGLIMLINFALAIINLVPIFLTDGYRLVYEEAKERFPSANDSSAKRIAIAAGVVSVILLLINFLPSFK